MLLNSTDIIQLITSIAGTVHVQTGWADLGSNSFSPGRTNTVISAAATTTIVASPTAPAIRQVKTITIVNRSATVTTTVSVVHNDGSNAVTVYSHALLPGEMASYDGTRWESFDEATAENQDAQSESLLLMRRMVKLLESNGVVDYAGRIRMVLDSLPGAVITSTVPISGSVTATVASTTITANGGNDPRYEFMELARIAYATGIRAKIT
jgi:hypothetical protein